MKTIYKNRIAIILSIVLTGNCFSQTVDDSSSIKGGLYLSAEDYLTGKLTRKIDCTKEKEKIKMHDFFMRPYIDIISDDKTYRYKKDDIFGVKDCDNLIYRFYDDKEYQILEAKSVYIYSRQYVIVEQRGGIDVIDILYFSVGPEGKIKDLSISNIEKAFPNNRHLDDILQTECSRYAYMECSDEDIAVYDFSHKMYKINYLLSQVKNLNTITIKKIDITNRKTENWIVTNNGDTVHFKNLKITLMDGVKGELFTGEEKKFKEEEFKSLGLQEEGVLTIYDKRPLYADKPNEDLFLMKVVKQKGPYRYYEFEFDRETVMNIHIPDYYKMIYKGDEFITEVTKKNKEEMMTKYFVEKNQ